MVEISQVDKCLGGMAVLLRGAHLNASAPEQGIGVMFQGLSLPNLADYANPDDAPMVINTVLLVALPVLKYYTRITWVLCDWEPQINNGTVEQVLPKLPLQFKTTLEIMQTLHDLQDQVYQVRPVILQLDFRFGETQLEGNVSSSQPLTCDLLAACKCKRKGSSKAKPKPKSESQVHGKTGTPQPTSQQQPDTPKCGHDDDDDTGSVPQSLEGALEKLVQDFLDNDARADSSEDEDEALQGELAKLDEDAKDLCERLDVPESFK